MISLKPYLDSLTGQAKSATAATATETALEPAVPSRHDSEGVRNALSALLDAGIEHAVQVDTQEYANFRQNADCFRATDDESDRPLEQLLANVGAAAYAIETYNARISRIAQKQSEELRNMVVMLTQAVMKIAGSASGATGALSSIQTNLEQAAAVEDIQNVRQKLDDCLQIVCEECVQQQTSAGSMIRELEKQIEQAQRSVTDFRELDRVTRLPMRAAAEKAFAEALATREKHYVLTLVMDRLQSINARFGPEVGDQVLRAFRGYAETKLLEKGDRLFRWSGPTLVALLPRKQDMSNVRGVLRPALEPPPQQQIDTEDRSVMIPLAAAWSVIALIPPVENTAKYIERFVASQMPRDYV